MLYKTLLFSNIHY